GVADPVDGRGHGDAAGDGDEHPAERVEVKPEAEQRKQLRQRHGERRAGQRAHPGSDTGRAADRREDTDHDAAAAMRPGQSSQRSRDRPAERDRPAQSNWIHRPASPRNASTIASGRGGQPATSTSTGTTSRTAPVTPYAPANTPQLRAQSPTAITALGAGTAS